MGKALYILLLLPIIIVVNIALRRRMRSAKASRKPLVGRMDILNRLKKAEKFDPEAYEGETRRRAEEIQKKIAVVANDIYEDVDELNMDANLQKANEAEQESKHLNALIRSRAASWESAEKELTDAVEAAVAFLETTNFYPTELPFQTNSLKGKILDLKEARRIDPLSDPGVYKEDIKALANFIGEFKKLHGQTVKMIDSDPTGARHELKQQLYIYLQKGEFELARKTIKQLDKK